MAEAKTSKASKGKPTPEEIEKRKAEALLRKQQKPAEKPVEKTDVKTDGKTESKEVDLSPVTKLIVSRLNIANRDGVKFLYMKTDGVYNLEQVQKLINDIINTPSDFDFTKSILCVASPDDENSQMAISLHIPLGTYIPHTYHSTIECLTHDMERLSSKADAYGGLFKVDSPFKKSDEIQSRFQELMKQAGLYPNDEDEDDFTSLAESAGIEW